MKKLLLFLFILFGVSAAKAQFVYKIKADSVLITNDSCTAELIIENSTKNVKGFLVNKGNGRTEFRRATQLTDSSFVVAADTIVIRGIGRDSAMWKNDGILTGNRVIRVNSYDLFFRTPTVTSETWPGSGHVYIGDSAYVNPFITPPNGQDGQANAALIIAKKKNNNNENVDLLTMTTSDAGTKNGWLFQNYTNSAGKVQTRMYTYSNATSFPGNYSSGAYIHEAFAKSVTTASPVISVNVQDYDSVNNGSYLKKVQHRTLYAFLNGATPVLVIDSSENIGINAPSPKAKLHIVGSINSVQELIKLPSTQTQANPIIQIQNSNGDTLIENRAQYISNLVSMFIGRNSGINNTGSTNTSVGDNTLTANTIGSANTALGNRSLKSNTTGSYNTAVGNLALQLNTTARTNTAIGEDCLSHVTTGSYNTAVGGNTLKFMVDGIGNTAVGAYAGESLMGGSYNTLIGRSAGHDDNETTKIGHQNTMIGYRAGFNCGADTANVLIGYDVGEGNYSMGNNKLFIANDATTTPLIYGEFDNKILAVSPSGAKFGIGTKTPTASVHTSASTTSAASLRIPSGTAPASPNEGDIWQTSNNLVFNTNSTNYTLAKTLTTTATLDFGSTAAGAKTDLTVTVTDAADGDVVSIGVPNGSTVANGSFSAWVSASNTVTVRFTNNDLTTSYDPASGTFRVSVLKY